MADPVMVATGHTYDRVCIERWLAQGNRTCPVTGMRLRHLELTPNFALRNAIMVGADSSVAIPSSTSMKYLAGDVFSSGHAEVHDIKGRFLTLV